MVMPMRQVIPPSHIAEMPPIYAYSKSASVRFLAPSGRWYQATPTNPAVITIQADQEHAQGRSDLIVKDPARSSSVTHERFRNARSVQVFADEPDLNARPIEQMAETRRNGILTPAAQRSETEMMAVAAGLRAPSADQIAARRRLKAEDETPDDGLDGEDPPVPVYDQGEPGDEDADVDADPEFEPDEEQPEAAAPAPKPGKGKGKKK